MYTHSDFKGQLCTQWNLEVPTIFYTIVLNPNEFKMYLFNIPMFIHTFGLAIINYNS